MEISARYGVQLSVTVVLARLLAPADFGLLAILLVFTSVGALLTDAGFGVALIQRRTSTADDETTVFCTTSCTSLLAAIGMWFAAPHIAVFYQMPTLVPMARAIAWVLPLGALGAVPDALLTRQLLFQSRTRAQVWASLASACVAIVLAWRGAGAWSLVCQSLVESGVRTSLLWLLSGWRPAGRCRLKSLRELFGFGGFMLLSGLLSTVSTRIQSLLIGKLFDARALGLYTLAQNTPQAPASFMGSILNRVGLPLFSALAHDPDRLRLALRVSLRTSMFLFLPCMVGIALAAGPLVDLVYGTKWNAAAPMLALLALATALWPVHVLNLVALSAQGRTDLYFRLEVIKNLVTVAAALAASPLGPVAVAAAMLAVSLCAAVINTWYSGKMLHYGLLRQAADQAQTIATMALAALPAWGILHWMPPRGLLPTCAAILVAAAIYIGASVLFKHPALQEVRGLLTTMLRPSERLPSDAAR